MIPFAENLGVTSDEFIPWEKTVSTTSSRIVLVEGELDVSYFKTIKEKFPKLYALPSDVDIVPYNGVGALKNTQLLKFMISRLDRVFVTCDLDAIDSVRKNLLSIGLTENVDFCSIGVTGHGKDCIEGLLPKEILKAVYSDRIEDVTALTSTDNAARKTAKTAIKKACIEKFKAKTISENDLNEFKKLIGKISKAFK